jgi:uncharacterized membrane protein (UPF0127 family)
MGKSEVRKHFFSEEKKQKTFDFFGYASWKVTLQGTKVFCFFFSKKKILAFFLAFAPMAARAVDGPQPELPTQHLVIISKSGAQHGFTVEIASTPQEQETGEMFRTSIPADRGMFFDWGTPREMTMWMKNCPVPEDMVFIGADGTITHIAENTVPESESYIPSGGPVRATLELQGGLTAKLGIEVGDKVSGVIFGK